MAHLGLLLCHQREERGLFAKERLRQARVEREHHAVAHVDRDCVEEPSLQHALVPVQRDLVRHNEVTTR